VRAPRMPTAYSSIPVASHVVRISISCGYKVLLFFFFLRGGRLLSFFFVINSCLALVNDDGSRGAHLLVFTFSSSSNVMTITLH
jgi:hypothetical protein